MFNSKIEDYSVRIEIMSGFLDNFRKKILVSVFKEDSDIPKTKEIDDKIALGVLLWIVAEADDKFLPEEEIKIKDILVEHGNVKVADMPVVLAATKEAAVERVDLYRFTNEIGDNLPYDIKKEIIHKLFCVACTDNDLDNNELEAIRKISGLFNISHKDFIDLKIQTKKEFGLSVAGA